MLLEWAQLTVICLMLPLSPSTTTAPFFMLASNSSDSESPGDTPKAKTKQLPPSRSQAARQVINAWYRDKKQSQLAEKARIRMAKHREKVKADPALAEDYRKHAQEASSVHRQRRHTILAANQRIHRILKSHEGKCSSHRKELEEMAAGPRNYEEEVALYREIRADEKWQQSRWGMAALKRAMETED
ncbi:hypothetical protein C8J57DRAFT_1224183 [Mycena rebaudengoi]|nr:hypothetical protein C8J57DRAFT_1224183 [Mycena rebaudengoi]